MSSPFEDFFKQKPEPEIKVQSTAYIYCLTADDNIAETFLSDNGLRYIKNLSLQSGIDEYMTSMNDALFQQSINSINGMQKRLYISRDRLPITNSYNGYIINNIPFTITSNSLQNITVGSPTLLTVTTTPTVPIPSKLLTNNVYDITVDSPNGLQCTTDINLLITLNSLQIYSESVSTAGTVYTNSGITNVIDYTNQSDPAGLISSTRTGLMGMKITAINNITSITIQKFSNCTCTKAYIYDSTLSTQLASASFSGVTATITYNLVAGTTYYILMDSAGSNYTEAYENFITPSTGTNVTYLSYYRTFDTGNVYSMGIYSLTTSSTGGTVTHIKGLLPSYLNNKVNADTTTLTFNLTGSVNALVTSSIITLKVSMDSLI